MKNLKKVLAAVLVVLMAVGLTACGGGTKGEAEVYFTDEDWVEDGYEGDCVNTNIKNLFLAPDGSYAYTEGMVVNQISGIIVFSNKTTYFGTYKVASEDSESKTVTLSAPTKAINIANGVTTSSEEDSSLLGGFAGGDMELDKEVYAIK